MAPVKVLVLGHSYVRRLHNYLIKTQQVNLNLALTGHAVTFFGRGGLQFARLLRVLSHACSPGYDLVLLEFGTNDLADGCPVELLVDRAIAVAETLIEKYGVKQVVFMEVLSRTTGRYRCPPNFNSEARRFNDALRLRVAGDRRMHVHHHRGMVANWEDNLEDGVHLNATGMLKYVNSVRRAVLRYSSRHLVQC